jgi:hypothetical protein
VNDAPGSSTSTPAPELKPPGGRIIDPTAGHPSDGFVDVCSTNANVNVTWAPADAAANAI